jgi:hypothetical protein
MRGVLEGTKRAAVSSPAKSDRGSRMHATRTLRSGIRVQHLYEEMTRDKRPQDIGRNGSTLRFTRVEHLGSDV